MQHLKRGFVEITEQVYVSNVSQVIIHQKTSMATGSVCTVLCADVRSVQDQRQLKKTQHEPKIMKEGFCFRDDCRSVFGAFQIISHICILYIISSVRSSSGYHGLIEIRSSSKATFSNFSNSSDSKVKVKVKGPNMCYIFEKHWIQGYRI